MSWQDVHRRCQAALFPTQIVAGICVYDTCGKIELSIFFRVRISLLSVFFAVRLAFIVDLVVGHVYSTSALAG